VKLVKRWSCDWAGEGRGDHARGMPPWRTIRPDIRKRLGSTSYVSALAHTALKRSEQCACTSVHCACSLRFALSGLRADTFQTDPSMPWIMAKCQSICRRSNADRAFGNPLPPVRECRPFHSQCIGEVRFGYSLFHQWPRFRLWAQQSDPGQHCRGRRRILQVLPALVHQARRRGCAAQDTLAGRAAQVGQGCCRACHGGGRHGRFGARCQGCEQVGEQVRPDSCPCRRFQRQGCLGCAPGRTERAVSPAARHGQATPRLSHAACGGEACLRKAPALSGTRQAGVRGQAYRSVTRSSLNAWPSIAMRLAYPTPHTNARLMFSPGRWT